MFLEDCSVNGTYVNDSLSRLHKNERIQLKSGDDIYLINPRYVIGDDGNKSAAFLFVNMRERMMAQRSVGVAPTVSADRPLVRHIEDDYVIGDEIGKGMSGVVYLCTHRTSGLQCAVKIIDTKKFGLAPGLSPAELREEAQIMKTLNHPSIIKIHDTYETNHVIYIVMELVRGGDLFDSIVVRGRYTEEQARDTMTQIFSAVQYLHNNDIIHRDLKPENILLMEPDGGGGSVVPGASPVDKGNQVRITDFGLAKKTTQEGLKTFCGTPQYFAPEVLKRRSSVTGAGRYGKAADMWSLGVILFILLSGTFPFDEDALFDQIAGAQYNMNGVEWYHVSQGAKNLISSLMTLMPHERLTISQAVQHPWLCGGTVSADGGEHCAPVASTVSAFNPFSRLMSSAGAQNKPMGPPKKVPTISKKQKSVRSQKSVTGAANKKQRSQSNALFFEVRPASHTDKPAASVVCIEDSPPAAGQSSVGPDILLTTQRPCIGSMFNSATRCGSVHTVQASLLRSESSIVGYGALHGLKSPLATPFVGAGPCDPGADSSSSSYPDSLAVRSPLSGLNPAFGLLSPSIRSREIGASPSSSSISTPTLLLLKKKNKKGAAGVKKTCDKPAAPEIADAFLKQKARTVLEAGPDTSPRPAEQSVPEPVDAVGPTAAETVLMDVDVNVCGRQPAAAAVDQRNLISKKLTQQKLNSNCFGKNTADDVVAVGNYPSVPAGAGIEQRTVGVAIAPPSALVHGGFSLGNPASKCLPNPKKVRVKMRTLQEMFAK